MIRHNLYEIDLERKTAFCTACGRTEIHVVKSRTNPTPKVICINRLRESNQANRNHKSVERRLQPGWKPRHRLSGIDCENMTALCSLCGGTEIRKRTVKQSTYYMCANKERAYMRKYQRSRYTSQLSNPLLHILSNIDEENKNAVCSICGSVSSIYGEANER